jgi:Caspase domain
MIRNSCLSFLTLILGFLTTNDCQAQGLTAKTNELSINLATGIPNSSVLPTIQWIFPRMEYTNSQDSKIEVKAHIKSISDVRELKLVVLNGIDGAILATKKFPTSQNQKEYPVSATITLPDGNNYLSLEVTTETGVTVSERRQILTGKGIDDTMVAIDRKDYVLLFATNKYDHWDDLVNPIDDAHAIANELKEKYGFVVDLVEDATVETVWEKLREYNQRKYGLQDQLMVFFAGHGHFDESFGEGYVVAKNSLSNDVSRTTYLSHNRLRGVINNIPCKHILLTMDVCFGGTLDPVIARSRGSVENETSVNQMLVRKWSHQTRKYLTSGGKVYVSDGIVGKHSPFAGKLLETLRARGGDDGILTLAELQAQLEKLAQTPRFGSFGEDEPLSDFVFVGK